MRSKIAFVLFLILIASSLVFLPGSNIVQSTNQNLATYWAPMGFPATFTANITVGATTPVFFEAVIPYQTTLNTAAFYIGTALGSACTGGTCGVKWSIWSKNCVAKLVETVAFTNAGTSSVVVTSALGSALILSPGQYCVILGTDSAVLQLAQPGLNATLNGMFNQASPVLIGTCGNSMAGNGAAIAFPVSCGVKTANAGVLFDVVFTP